MAPFYYQKLSAAITELIASVDPHTTAMGLR